MDCMPPMTPVRPSNASSARLGVLQYYGVAVARIQIFRNGQCSGLGYIYCTPRSEYSKVSGAEPHLYDSETFIVCPKRNRSSAAYAGSRSMHHSRSRCIDRAPPSATMQEVNQFGFATRPLVLLFSGYQCSSTVVLAVTVVLALIETSMLHSTTPAGGRPAAMQPSRRFPFSRPFIITTGRSG
jgi:hypothetical protein